MNTNPRNRHTLLYFMLAGVLMFAGIGGCTAAYMNTATTVSVKIKRLERITTNQGGKYLVFTDKGVFENTDTLLFWKFNSSDIYGQLEVGKTYTLRVVGWRWQAWSIYPNIIEVLR